MVWKDAAGSTDLLCKLVMVPLLGLLGLIVCYRLLFSGFWTILDYNSTFNRNGLHTNLTTHLNTHEFLRKTSLVGIYGKSHR